MYVPPAAMNMTGSEIPANPSMCVDDFPLPCLISRGQGNCRNKDDEHMEILGISWTNYKIHHG